MPFTICWHAWASAAAAADKLVPWFTGWEGPWQAVGHGSRMARFGTDFDDFGTHVRWGPSFFCFGGPGEPLGGSVRPRGRPLRPPRAWTAPTADAYISPGGGKGLKLEGSLTARRRRQAHPRCASGSAQPPPVVRARHGRGHAGHCVQCWFGSALTRTSARALGHPARGADRHEWPTQHSNTVLEDSRAAQRAGPHHRSTDGSIGSSL